MEEGRRSLWMRRERWAQAWERCWRGAVEALILHSIRMVECQEQRPANHSSPDPHPSRAPHTSTQTHPPPPSPTPPPPLAISPYEMRMAALAAAPAAAGPPRRGAELAGPSALAAVDRALADATFALGKPN